MEEKIINMNQFLGAAQGDQEHMLGKFLYSEHVIRRWYTTCGLAVVRLGTRTYIPKKGLLRFIGSKSFHSIKEKSAAHVDLIRSVDYEGA